MQSHQPARVCKRNSITSAPRPPGRAGAGPVQGLQEGLEGFCRVSVGARVLTHPAARRCGTCTGRCATSASACWTSCATGASPPTWTSASRRAPAPEGAAFRFRVGAEKGCAANLDERFQARPRARGRCFQVQGRDWKGVWRVTANLDDRFQVRQALAGRCC